ncbi:MAG: hypothetical protein U0973_11195, partial [Xanthomonadaceae bacterium]|nr:hypothetical protein [Xanthomonadaceae bacterium]
MDGDARADITVVVDNPSGGEACRAKLRVYRNVANPSGGAAQAQFTPYPDICLAGQSAVEGGTGQIFWFIEQLMDIRDLDGNGLPDITLSSTTVSETPAPARILYGVRDASGGWRFDSRPWASLFPASDPAPAEERLEWTWHTWLDVNGDGLDDRLYVRTEGGVGKWTLRLNTGSGLAPRIFLPNSDGLETCDGFNCNQSWQARYAGKFRIDDIDGDGRAELLFPSRFASRICASLRDPDGGIPQGGVGTAALPDLATYCPEDPVTNALTADIWQFTEDANRDGVPDGTIVDQSPPSRLYQSGFAIADASSYVMGALRFVETGTNQFSVQRVPDTGIIIGPSDGSVISDDLYGDGLPDSIVSAVCPYGVDQCLIPVADGNGNPLPEAISPRTLPGGLPLLSPAVLVNENRGPGGRLNPDGKTPQVPDLLAMATDGLGNQALWTYYPRATAAGRAVGDLPLYTVPGPGAARYIDAQHIYFTSSMPVVSTFIRSDGVGGLRSWSYGYREAMYNQMGRGMQGFRTLIEEDDGAGLRTTTTFHQKFPLTGQVERVVVNPIARDGEVGMIRSEDQVWRCNRANRADATACSGPAPANGVWFPYLDSRESKIFDASQALLGTPALISRTLQVNADDSTCEGAFAPASGFDATGNLTASTQLTFDEGAGSAGFEHFVALHCQRSRSSYTVNTASWWLDRLTQTSTTTHQVFGAAHALPAGASAPDQSQTSTFSWNANRTPASQTLQPGVAGQARTTTFAYPATNYGLPSAVTVSAAGDANGSRTTSTTYSADGYFPQTVSNPLGQSSTTLIRSRDGQPSQSSDIQNHLSRFSYDVFGRSVRAEFLASDGVTRLQPDQRMALTASGGGYQITSVQDGAPTQVSVFDAFGRVIRTQTKLQDGTWSNVDSQYDALGRQTATSAPYRSTPSFTRITGFDLAGRPLGKTSPADGDDGNASRVTTYSYIGRETRIAVCGNLGGACLDMSRSQDSLGRFVRTLDAQGGLTRTWADGSGNVVALQDVAGSTIKASYNALGQRISVS